jgi:PHD/YefM family antitoxin component YafN of YafNO toxin-antitoxin module
VPSGEARQRLGTYLKQFRRRGAAADPVVIGSYRKPEAVILSYARYAQIVEILDNLDIRDQVERRLAESTEEGVELAEAMRRFGYDLAAFGIE